MIITAVKDSDKTNFMALLLLADEDLKMIEKYLYRGELFALYDDGLKSVCVVTRESDSVCELKNIATYEKWHGKGYGSQLLEHVFSHYKDQYATMRVGTGDVPWILQFYQKNGFKPSHRVRNFFNDNYDHPMFEDGVQLVDMVYLSKDL
ncbi:GNAT family N-acetyltransferase [Eubacterium sp. 1001713B170207_170306_E7]|uniref:GNAT family N-acetyltransferase n=1 Tax=Eubacterium sp. 1001713B170207_170306_E7 TaxID=2787097 RepID=UPI00189B0173|nr:GNAT family N-acetyltransferase [Eubacterium sp. 1001713B170207_170306_E7]